ncbi:MAG: O-antigen ligase family protein [Bacteroidales bacterium]|nr:O-antigen ligase family protein [Bacteroidales bacterium]
MKLSGCRLPYAWVRIYVLTLLACACFGNDFLKFPLFGLPFNPYRLLGLAAPIVLLFAPAPFWRTLWKGGARLYALFVAVLCAYALLSGLWVADSGAWATHSLFLVYGALTTWLILGCLDSRMAVIRALRVLEVCAAVVAVGALVEILSGHYWFNDLYAGNYFWARDKSIMHLPLPVFAMGNVNDFGAYLFFALAAALWLMMADKHRVWRFGRFRLRTVYGHAAVAALFLFLMLCTQSRAIFLGLILAGAAGFGCYLLLRPPHWRLWLGMACGLFVLAMVAFVLFWLYDAPGDVEAHSDAVRMGVARNAWVFFKPVWFRGLGWGGVDYYNLQYPVYTVGDVPHLHNWFLELLFSCGLFVFVFYAWVYIRTWWRCLQVAVSGRQSGNGRGLVVKPTVWQAVVFVAVLSGFTAVSLAASSFVPDQWFWAVWALCFGAAGKMEKQS